MSDQSDSPIIHLPFLDDEFETDSGSGEGSNTKSSESSDTGASQRTQESHLLVKSADETNTHKQCDAGTSSETNTQRADIVSDSVKRKPLSPKEQARLTSLKTMLDASNTRYKQATRNRRPVFAAGLEVSVTNGEHTGKTGVVLDADYIENRALISLPDQTSPRWIAFRSLGHSD